MANAADVTTDERALLWDAIEGSYLIEMRNGSDDYPNVPIHEYRQRVAAALLGLLAKGLARAYLAPWEEPRTLARYMTIDEVQASLTSGTAWDTEQTLCVAFEATPAGEAIQLGPPSGH